LARDVEQQSAVKDVDFIRVIFSPLQAAIHSEATSWVAAIGKHLNAMALEGVSEIETKLAKFDEHLTKKPGTIAINPRQSRRSHIHAKRNRRNTISERGRGAQLQKHTRSLPYS
jgi:hypothetical protein